MTSIRSLIKNGSIASDLTNQYNEEQKKHQFLTQQYFYINNNQYIEEQAREKLGLAKNGEYIVLVPSPTQNSSRERKINNESNWQKWWNLFVY